MKTLIKMIGLGVCALAIGCGDDVTSNQDAGGDFAMTMSPDLSSAFPAAPTIGSTQLDRMGRAGVNTALTDPFFTDKTAHEAKQDAYNQAQPADWGMFTDQFASALAVFDGLDGHCDNQPLANPAGSADGGATGEYGTLASILTNDQLLLFTGASSCAGATNYLAVEVSVITSTTPASCGGRTPLDNVIDTTYAVVSGSIASGVPVINGVTADGDPQANSATLSAFPYLGTPQ